MTRFKRFQPFCRLTSLRSITVVSKGRSTGTIRTTEARLVLLFIAQVLLSKALGKPLGKRALVGITKGPGISTERRQFR